MALTSTMVFPIQLETFFTTLAVVSFGVEVVLKINECVLFCFHEAG